MPNISYYGTRTSVAATDRLFIASSTSDTIQSATAGLIMDDLLSAGLDSLGGTTTAAGALAYRGASSWTVLGIGTTGQVLTVSGGVPTWAAGGGGGGGNVDILPYTRPRASSFGTFGSTGGTLTVAEPFVSYGPIQTTIVGGTTNSLVGLTESITSEEWMLTAYIRGSNFLAGNANRNLGIGIMNAAGNIFTFLACYQSFEYGTYKWNSATSYEGNLTMWTDGNQPNNRIDEWVRFHRDPANSNALWFLRSNDGIIWSPSQYSGEITGGAECPSGSGTFSETTAVFVMYPNGYADRMDGCLYHWELASGTGTIGGTVTSLNHYAPATLTFDPAA